MLPLAIFGVLVLVVLATSKRVSAPSPQKLPPLTLGMGTALGWCTVTGLLV
jgi:hypothetical protein